METLVPPPCETLHYTQSVEDYLRTILLLREHDISPTVRHLATLLGVSLATVSSSLKRLEREGVIHRDERHRILLTPVGQAAAECVMRRNRLVERFLYDVLHVPLANLAVEANRMEHAITPKTERRLQLLLDFPTTCPHGNPIEPGAPAEGERLAAYRFGQIEIVRLYEAVAMDAGFMGWVAQHGLMPGERFEVVSTNATRVVLGADDGTLTVHADAAQLILARFAGAETGDRPSKS